jgi:signal transduction histidine kinase
VNAAIGSDERFIETAMTDVVDEHQRVAGIMMLVSLLALALAIVSGVAARRLARRLASTTSAVRAFAAGEYVPIGIHGNDEIAELGNAFNTMSVDVRRAREQEKLFAQRTVEATESERMHLAAELHDGPIQRLTGLLYGLERVATRIERDQLDGLADFLRDARTKVSSEVGALRHLLSELRPPVLAERGLGAAVRDYLSSFAHHEGLEYEADVRLDERVSDSLETTMYRILQEALANVSKHADAHRVVVSLWDDGESVRMRVADDGCGFDPDGRADSGGEHFGIAGMLGRARYSGGSVEIGSAPGKGTIVSATLPTGRSPMRAPVIIEKVAS